MKERSEGREPEQVLVVSLEESALWSKFPELGGRAILGVDLDEEGRSVTIWLGKTAAAVAVLTSAADW